MVRGTGNPAAGLVLASGLPLLHPEEQVFSAMLDGWRNQQLARNLAVSTVDGREVKVRAFARHATCSRGSGRRSWLMSGSATCARCTAAPGPR